MGSLYEIDNRSSRHFGYWESGETEFENREMGSTPTIDFLNKMWPWASTTQGLGSLNDYATITYTYYNTSTEQTTINKEVWKRMDNTNTETSWQYVTDPSII
jgi:hypothetical protein